MYSSIRSNILRCARYRSGCHRTILALNRISSVAPVPPTFRGPGRYFANAAVEKNVIGSPYRDVLIPKINVAHHVMNSFQPFLNNTAFVDGVTGKTWTYAQLQDAIIKVGSVLTKQGIKKGDIVTLCSPNCPEFAIVFLAITAVGGVVSTVNPLYTPGELQHAVSHNESKLLVTIPQLADMAKAAAKSCPQLKEIVVFGAAEGCRSFSSWLEDDGKSFPENVDIDAEKDLCALPYSSGTTGLPKGVMLSHYNIVANLKQLNNKDVIIHDSSEVFLSVLPFFHIYGMVVVLFMGLLNGVKNVTMPSFVPETYLELAQKHKASYLHVVPPLILFLAKHPMVSKFDLSSVQSAFTGAAPVGPQTIEEASDRIGLKSFRQGYGLTESSPVTHVNPISDFKYHTVGVPVPNLQHKIVDLTTGEALGPMEEGELVVRGPNVMLGYYKNPEATADTIRDNWLHTGDIGYYEEDRHVVISDRLKELIKVKGLQVAPAELEALLVTHPSIQDAAVIGVADERAGELPRAYVVLKPSTSATEKDIVEFVKGKVASFKELTGGVEFRQEIPKSASGKILRRQLKEELKK